MEATSKQLAPSSMAVRKTTRLDYEQRLDRVCAHLEARMDQPPDLAELAGVAGFSPFHFHRVFSALRGEAINEYVRRIRLERAALLLRHGNRSITDIALAVGYESPAAFSRAFERMFATSPSKWRAENRIHPSRGERHAAPLSTITPERIVERTPTRVTFVRRHGPYVESAPAAWAALMNTISWRLWLHFPAEMIGLCHDDPEVTAPSQVRYDACLVLRRAHSPRGELAEKVIPGGRHAVFMHRGEHARLVETYDRIYGAWLPDSEEKLGEAPAFEIYLDHPERTPAEKIRTLIHLPLLPLHTLP